MTTEEELLKFKVAHLRLMLIASRLNREFMRSREFVHHTVLNSWTIDQPETIGLDFYALVDEVNEIVRNIEEAKK